MAEKKLTEAEQLDRLGIRNPEAPGGGAVEIEEEQETVDTSTVQEPEEQQTLDLEDNSEEEQSSSTQDEQGNIKPEELERRSWQAQADKEKAEIRFKIPF